MLSIKLLTMFGGGNSMQMTSGIGSKCLNIGLNNVFMEWEIDFPSNRGHYFVKSCTQAKLYLQTIPSRTN